MKMDKKFFESVECALPHKCPKEKNADSKCAHCDVAYSFIACEPKSLQCGHQICNECTNNIKNGSLKCKICSSEMTYLNAPASASDFLVSLSLRKLTEELKEKYNIALSLFTDSETEAELNVMREKQKVKNQIDAQLEEMKNELEGIRNDFYREVDEIGENALKAIKDSSVSNAASFKEIAIELELLSQQAEIDKNKFYEYQKSLKEMIDILNKFYCFKFEINYSWRDLNRKLQNLMGHLNCKIELPRDEMDDKNELKENEEAKKENNEEKKKRYLLSGSIDKKIKVWDLMSKKCVKILSGHNEDVRFIKPIKENIIASVSDDRTIKLWDISNGSCIHSFDAHENHIYTLELMDENTLISGSTDRTIKVWDLEKKALNYTISEDNAVWAIKLIQLNILASSFSTGKIKIWDLKEKRCLYELSGHNDAVYCLELIDENKLASCSFDGTIKIWNLKKRSCILTTQSINCCIFSVALVEPNVLAGGCEDGIVRFWDLSNGNLLFILNGHANRVRSLQILQPNILISGCADNTIKFWNIKTRKCTDSLAAHNGCVYCLALF